MSTDLAPIPFDYGDLPEADQKALEEHADAIEEIQSQVRRVGAEGVIAIGKMLTAAHNRLAGKGREGRFGKWAELRCGFTRRTAENAIQVYTTFGDQKYENVFVLFDASALYVLSADSCPEKATKEAIRRAKKGEQITHKRAKQLKAKHTPSEEPDTMPDETESETESESEPTSTRRATNSKGKSRAIPITKLRALIGCREALDILVSKPDMQVSFHHVRTKLKELFKIVDWIKSQL